MHRLPLGDNQKEMVWTVCKFVQLAYDYSVLCFISAVTGRVPEKK